MEENLDFTFVDPQPRRRAPMERIRNAISKSANAKTAIIVSGFWLLVIACGLVTRQKGGVEQPALSPTPSGAKETKDREASANNESREVPPPSVKRARTFWPNNVNEIERIVDGKAVLYIYYREPRGGMVRPSDLASELHARQAERERIQNRKEAAEKSGQYDKVIVSAL